MKQWYPWTQDPRFVFAVVKKYLPFLADRVGGELREADAEREKKNLDDKMHVAGSVPIFGR